MAQVRIADLPTTSLIDPESFVIIERPGFGDGTFKSTVGDLQRVITVSAKVEQFDNITRITIDDINGHTEEDIFTPVANVRNNGDNTVTITITDASGTTEETILRDARSFDPVPTEGSNNIMTSGAIYNMQQEIYSTMNERLAAMDQKVDDAVEHVSNMIDDAIDRVDAMVKNVYERVLTLESIVEIAYITDLTDESGESLVTQGDEVLIAPQYGSISEMNIRGGQPTNTFYADGYMYETLSEAILAVAQTGGTIVLMGNTSNQGLSVPSGSHFTLDLNGYMLDITGPGAGSHGTETNGFQLLKDSTIEIKDGILKFEDNRLKIGIQNYSNLTLDNVKVFGGPTIQYVVSNNYGDIVFKNNTEIHRSGNNVAFDCWYGMSAVYDHPGVNTTIEDDTVVIDGKVEFGKARRASLIDFEENASITCPVDYELSITELTSPCAWDDNGDGTKTFRYQKAYTELTDEGGNHLITQKTEEDILAPIEDQG